MQNAGASGTWWKQTEEALTRNMTHASFMNCKLKQDYMRHDTNGDQMRATSEHHSVTHLVFSRDKASYEKHQRPDSPLSEANNKQMVCNFDTEHRIIKAVYTHNVVEWTVFGSI